MSGWKALIQMGSWWRTPAGSRSPRDFPSFLNWIELNWRWGFFPLLFRVQTLTLPDCYIMQNHANPYKMFKCLLPILQFKVFFSALLFKNKHFMFYLIQAINFTWMCVVHRKQRELLNKDKNANKAGPPPRKKRNLPTC